MNARALSDRIAALLRKEQSAMADFLRALADFDREKRWRELGYGSLFQYLRVELCLSAGAAQYRKTAVELIQTVPAVEAALGDGRLCLSSIIELAKVLKLDNVADVLPRFFGLSRREAEAVAVSLRPAEVIPRREVVTPIRRAEPAAARRDAATEEPALRLRPAEPAPRAEVAPTLAPVPPRDSEEPLDAKLSRLHITVSRAFMAKLQETKDALSHSHPGASTEEILTACMDLMLATKVKQKGVVERPLKTPRPSRTDRIPAHVKRAAWERAGGRCEWRFESGERCGCTTRLEFDHIDPRSRGGPPTIDNVRVACRPHNLLAARRVFGDAWMDRFTAERSRTSTPAGGRAPPATGRAPDPAELPLLAQEI